MKYRLFLLASALLFSSALLAQEMERKIAFDNYRQYANAAREMKDAAKEASILAFRDHFSKHPYRGIDFSKSQWKEYVPLLMADGSFSDLKDEDAGKAKGGNAADSAGSIADALNRIMHISEAFRHGVLTVDKNADIWDRCQKSILRYGDMEIGRPNTWQRFHSSCFAIPTVAVNIYFCHLKQMEDVEQGRVEDKQLSATCDMLKMLALQAWTQPFRNDETDKNVVQIERFRHHVWWVGGNALAYRSLLPVAFMYRSIPMIDLLSEVCRKAISVTSQQTYEESFWNEGFTVDGAGWGHGKQCLIWGYPIDGTLNALNMLSMLKGSPWEQKLTRENVDALLNYFRGSNYYYYKGYALPCLDRNSMSYQPSPSVIRYGGMLKQLIEHWADSFTSEELQEIKQLYAESQEKSIRMAEYGNVYNGTHWFFNNDDLMKKNDRYHITVNMTSVRCDGIESANGFADCYNFYTTDGSTLFQKSGDEYRKVFGAFDVTAFPGVTAREGMDKLVPVTNWRGYCSKHNFAAAATLGGENAVAGHIFEKMNGSDKEGVNDQGDNQGKNALLYGVQAYKAYFMLGDYMVALGAGITNKQPEMEGNIRTTIEQTAKTGEVYAYKGKGIEWVVQQDKFAYSVFPEYRQKARYVCETKKTDWVKMNQSNQNKKDLPAEVDIFRMWIDHGQAPVNDTYGYVVYAGEGMPATKYPFKVLRNDTLVQAVQSLDGKIIEAVFYNEQSNLKTGKGQLSVSAPCAILIEQDASGVKFSVTDALMNKDCKKINVMWNGKIYSCDMPDGQWCGKPAVYIDK
ncbi:polysaccharide lyase family 8 super-sandwich domain-containing protein [uncultured Bacteroides sp.]|uniref:polysaccharide lyase family 8 super-sandwich domain-containing protein n=1 Tax=uncultured Bacteroides sp. TaxID=162156 RepID=UPI0025EB713F|nr:polysaccharide lyase family 8 super-sandwich domain-containing protein [uncultured Bacteroides sp.]